MGLSWTPSGHRCDVVGTDWRCMQVVRVGRYHISGRWEQDRLGSLHACRQMNWPGKRTNCSKIEPVGMRRELTLAGEGGERMV